MSNWEATISDLLRDYFEAESVAFGLRQSAADIARQKKEAEAKAKSIKENLRDLLTEQGVVNEAHPLADLIISKGRESVRYADDFDPKNLPIEYVKVERKADGTQIKAALARGEKLEGVELVTGQPSLSIKRKEMAHG